MRYTVHITGERVTAEDVRRAVIRVITERNPEAERYGIDLAGIVVVVERVA